MLAAIGAPDCVHGDRIGQLKCDHVQKISIRLQNVNVTSDCHEVASFVISLKGKMTMMTLAYLSLKMQK